MVDTIDFIEKKFSQYLLVEWKKNIWVIVGIIPNHYHVRGLYTHWRKPWSNICTILFIYITEHNHRKFFELITTHDCFSYFLYFMVIIWHFATAIVICNIYSHCSLLHDSVWKSQKASKWMINKYKIIENRWSVMVEFKKK